MSGDGYSPRDYGSYVRQDREWREVCGQDSEEDYVEDLIREFDAQDITYQRLPLRSVQGSLFTHGEMAA